MMKTIAAKFAAAGFDTEPADRFLRDASGLEDEDHLPPIGRLGVGEPSHKRNATVLAEFDLPRLHQTGG